VVVRALAVVRGPIALEELEIFAERVAPLLPG